MNEICFIGFGRVGQFFLKKILKKKKNDTVNLNSIIFSKINIKKKRYLEKKKKTNNKIFISISYKRFLKNSSIVIELVGDTFFSKEAMLFSLINKKKYITANKKLIYKKNKLIRKFLYKNIFFESSIGASIPLVYSINNFFRLKRIKKIESILNGTTNYVVSKATKKKTTLTKILKKSYEKGFSEKNPISDISGFDSFNKTFIIINLFFDVLNFKCEFIGIEKIMCFRKIASFLKKKIKLISIIKKKKRVIYSELCPFLVKKKSSFYNCNGINNIIKFKTFEKEVFSLFGPGAGVETTSSSIYSDIFRKRGFSIKKNNIFFYLDIIKKNIIFNLKKKNLKKILFFLNKNFFFKVLIFKKYFYIKSDKCINKKRTFFILNFFKKKTFLKIK
ncbi:Homoserine dehydrogenase [Candidatus Vidania fulgoroideae]|nr:Homoserine dehydrogenase [Candidatus Vidania fulgoroideae]